MVATQRPPAKATTRTSPDDLPSPQEPDWDWAGAPGTPGTGPEGPYGGPAAPHWGPPTLRELNAARVAQTARRATQELLRQHQRHVYYRESGVAAALRHTLQMDPVPAHARDYVRGLRYQEGPSRRWARPRTLADMGLEGPPPRPGRGSRVRPY